MRLKVAVVGALTRDLLDLEVTRDDFFEHLLGDGPIAEEVEGDVVGLAVSGKIVVLLILDKQNIGVTSGRHVRDTVTGEEERGSVLELTVRSDGERLVVSKVVVGVTVDEFPGFTLLLGVGEVDLVGDDVDLVGVLLANEVGENGADDGGHTGGNNNDGDVVGLGESVELLETRVKGDIATNKLLHLGEGTLNGLDHLFESLTVRETLLDDLDVELTALGVTHTDGVDHVVVGVLFERRKREETMFASELLDCHHLIHDSAPERRIDATYEKGDRTVKIGKKDIFGIGVLEVRHDCELVSRGSMTGDR